MKTFLEEIMQVPFGSMTKKELEIKVLELLVRVQKIDMSNTWALSRTLKISKTKAESLAYDYYLRQSKDDEMIQNALDAFPQISADGKIFSLCVQCKYVRDLIRGILREKGLFSNYSLAEDVVQFEKDGYEFLLETYKSDIYASYKKQKMFDFAVDTTTGILMGPVYKILGDCAGKKLTDGLGALLKGIKNTKEKI